MKLGVQVKNGEVSLNTQLLFFIWPPQPPLPPFPPRVNPFFPSFVWLKKIFFPHLKLSLWVLGPTQSRRRGGVGGPVRLLSTYLGTCTNNIYYCAALMEIYNSFYFGWNKIFLLCLLEILKFRLQNAYCILPRYWLIHDWSCWVIS